MSEPVITKEFVQTLLKTPVKEFHVKKATNDGDNAAGALINIIVTTEAGQNLTLIHKTIPTNPHSKHWAVTAKIFWVENAIYSVIIPKIHEVISRIPGYDYNVPVPKLFAALNNDQDDYITLEDLRPQGFLMPDKFKGLTLPQVSLIMKELGKFHGATRALLEKEPDILNNFPYIRANKWAEDPEKTAGILAASAEFMLSLIENEKPEAAQQIRQSLQKAGGPYNIFNRLVEPQDKFLEVVIHGDLWVNNVMIKYTKDEETPTDLRFIDFQLTGKDSIFVDLIYFFYCSTTPEFRKIHFDHVLRIYLDSLIASLKGLQLHVPHHLNWETFRSKIQELRYPGFLLTFFALPFQLGMKPPFNQASAVEEADTAGLKNDPGNGGEVNGGKAEAEFTEENWDAETAKFYKILQDSFLSSPQGIERLMQLVDEVIELNVI